MNVTGMQREALDLLMNAPSSFAALYRTTLQEPTLARPGVKRAVADLRTLGEAGFIEFALVDPNGRYRAVQPNDFERVEAEYIAWLDGRPPSSIPVDETSLDEVGLWMQVTDRGRALRRNVNDEDDG